jgi:hypothetical protein
VDGIRSLSIEEVRVRRRRCSEVEVGVSYLRRLIQGRLDIVLAEAHRRESGAAPEDVASLVDRLPEILSEHVHSPGNGRLPALLAPSDADGSMSERIDAILDADRIAALPELDDTDLRSTVAALRQLERETSTDRRALHEVMDQFQDELVRRYKTGEASVDSLLA